MLVHDLDQFGMSSPVYQFDRVEFGCHQQGTSVVRHM